MMMNLCFLPSSAIVEAATTLTQRHLSILANGSKYVPRCQSYSSSTSAQTLIAREFDRMSSVIMDGLARNCVSKSDARAKLFFGSLKHLISQFYEEKLSWKLFRSVRREQSVVRNIRRQLNAKNNRTILRRTDKNKVFHLGSSLDYEEKALMYMMKTQAYEEVDDRQCPLQDNLTSIISSMNGPTIGVSYFFDRLLRPLFDHVAKQTTFVNGIDLVRQLEKYRDSGHLTTTTQFITFDVTDLYTMIPRDGALPTLGRCLNKYSVRGKIENLSVDTIMKLARLVLDTNCFVYDEKYYRQIKGGAMGSPFTMTLANVYMFEWEQPLIDLQTSQGELYGRYIDDVFMTSNMSISEIHRQLDWMNQKDEEHIRITYTVGSAADFLDVHIENHVGQLKTSVYRKPAAEPYVLSYASDHPRHVHANIPYEALLRAARLCSDVYAFDQERGKRSITNVGLKSDLNH
ncbi:unnamed protein product [Didymodactylos carnosus]|uniref:Helix-turn-helix domain-containing protein n=1 Tax=Didymodactylos carnosus TaxID=1234261 RepID=A0A815ANZ8_9BILA|nr:unnamed protein product [Didymodactylos carnosus]CAF1257074.1 unnamed protein product [Didymodactylos carnosus]CAF3714483.1 unnamed protein product [Didymodactylos carnosus]CAF4031304.1 unnamed protein product [Didymodactylos carnosus]